MSDSNIAPNAAITFSYDDGRLNNYELALPEHERANVPACFSLIADRVTNPKYWDRHMSPWHVVNAVERGVEINSHGYYHNNKFTALSDTELGLELVESKKVLQGFTPPEVGVETMCVPFSAVDEQITQRAGQNYALVRVHGRKLNKLNGNSNVITSHALHNDTSFESVKDLIDQAVAQGSWLVLMLHGVQMEESPKGRYNISVLLLRRILSYVNEVGEEKLKPITFNSVIKYRRKLSNKRFMPDIKRAGHYCLAESPGYLFTYHKHERQNDKVVISFGGLPSGKTESGFGSSFVRKLGYDHIFVGQAPLSQYQKLSLEEFVEIVSPYIQGKSVFTYGSSLGGYAALYYGGAINAGIISASPKNSAHPAMRQKRFSHVEFLHLPLQDNPVSSVEPLVLFDPYRKEESKFVDKFVMPAYPNANLIKLPFAGHTVLDTMRRSDVLSKFMTTYIDTGEVLPFELETYRSFVWHAEKGRLHLLHGELNEAEEHFSNSLLLDSGKDNGEAAAGLAKVHIARKDREAARQILVRYRESSGGLKGVPKNLRDTLNI